MSRNFLSVLSSQRRICLAPYFQEAARIRPSGEKARPRRQSPPPRPVCSRTAFGLRVFHEYRTSPSHAAILLPSGATATRLPCISALSRPFQRKRCRPVLTSHRPAELSQLVVNTDLLSEENARSQTGSRCAASLW